MASEGSVVLSVPPHEIAEVAVPGSIFELSVLLRSALSPELRLAVELIAVHAVSRRGTTYPSLGTAILSLGTAIRCVARPEIFAHGPPLDWLMSRLEGVTDHYSLSDGTSLKLIPTVRNHLFTYGLQSYRRHVDFRKLLRRAPEMLGQFASQVNTCHRVALEGVVSEPTPSILGSKDPVLTEDVWFHGFYLDPHSLEDSAELMLSWGGLDPPPVNEFEGITYIALSDIAAHDPHFQRLVARAIAAAYFDPTACVLIRLPAGLPELTARMRLALGGICAAGRHLPQVRSKNVFLLSGDLPERRLREMGPRLTLLLHQTFDHWRYTRDMYRDTKHVVVFLGAEWTQPSDTAKNFFREAIGRDPRFVVASRWVDADGFPGDP